MKSFSKYLLIVFVAVFGVSTNACKRNEQGEGAAEQAGKTIDKALEKAGEETGRVLERAGEKMQEYAEKSKETPPAKSAPAER
jgi:flagellar biosynthesis/type III secretory pathway M-ring protein FliF/YscJ